MEIDVGGAIMKGRLAKRPPRREPRADINA
jgi:hypothetical protein